MPTSPDALPLFPLQTVLFPGGVLPLRIFEPRYLDMVADCLRQSSGFGVCLIRAGREAGAAATIHDIGTAAVIHDWDQEDNGMLRITALGTWRFRVLSSWVEPDQLTMARVEWLRPEPERPVPVDARLPVKVLASLLEELGPPYSSLPRQLDDLGWVTARLTEILPLSLQTKQAWLSQADPDHRLEGLMEYLRQVD